MSWIPTRSAARLAGVSRHFRHEVSRLLERVDSLTFHELHFPDPLRITPPLLIRRPRPRPAPVLLPQIQAQHGTLESLLCRGVTSVEGTGRSLERVQALARAWLGWEAQFGLSKLARLSLYGWPKLAMPQAFFNQPNTYFFVPNAGFAVLVNPLRPLLA
jgi:hypothetical protein